MSWIGIAATCGAVVVAGLLALRPTLGVLALTVFYPFNEFVPRAPIPGVNSETILLSIALLSTLLRQRTVMPPARFSGPIFAYFILVLLGCAITASWYRNSLVTVTNVGNFMDAKSLLFPTLAFFPAYFWASGEAGRRRILMWMVYAMLIVSVAALIDWVFGIKAATRVTRRATGLFKNPNALGIFLGMLSAVPLYLLRGPNLSVGRDALLRGTYSLAMVALVLTLSRKAWLSVLLVHAVWFVYLNRTTLLLGAIALAFAATLAYPLLPDLIRDRIEHTFRPGATVYQAGLASRLDPSTGSRVVLHRIGLQMFLDSPVWGHGYNSVLLLTPRYGARYGLIQNQNPHSIPLKVMAESGLIGLGVLAWTAFVLLGVGRNIWSRGGTERALGPAFLAACSGLGLSGLAGTVIEDHQISLYFWLLFGLAARAEVEHARENAASARG